MPEEITTRTQYTADRLVAVLRATGLSVEDVARRIEPDGFAERLAGECPLYLSDVSEAAALVGVSAASLLGV